MAELIEQIASEVACTIYEETGVFVTTADVLYALREFEARLIEWTRPKKQLEDDTCESWQ